MKKKWEKPQLKVIVRTTPEESVLVACKQGLGQELGPNSSDGVLGCYASYAFCKAEFTS